MTLEEECRLATFIARPEWREVRHLVEQLAPGAVEPLEAVVKRVRKSVWRDFSEPT